MNARALSLLVALIALTAGGVASAADVQTITHGRAVELTDHLVPGKYVLFDFYADWCGPCRSLEPVLLDLAGRHADRLALRKVDVVNWESEVARQYRMTSIPYLVLYGPSGDKLAQGDPRAVLDRLGAALGAGGGSPRPSAGGSRSLVPVLAIAAIFAVAFALVVRKRRPVKPSAQAPSVAPPPRVDTAADPGDPAIWFAVLQGSLEGPFTRAQLAEMVRVKTIPRRAVIRRRGDAEWTPLADVLD